MPTNAEIQEFYRNNANNPAAIQQAMQQYGVNADQAAQATGQSASTFNNLGLTPANGFYGGNGVLYSNSLPNGATSFVASNGQTLTQDQVNQWYAQNGNRAGADIAMMDQMGLKGGDLYKARQLAGRGGTEGMIYTDPAEYSGYQQYRGQVGMNSGPGIMSFDEWRLKQDPSYLAGLQKNGASANGAVPTGGGGGTGGGAGGGGGGEYGGGGGSNPYLGQMADNITRQMQDNYTRNQLPTMRSGAMAAGGFGGSRQGVVESNSLYDLNNNIGSAVSNLYGTDWTNQQNRNLQQQQINNQFTLGQGNLGLGYANLDANINNSNNSNQLNWANFGLNVNQQQFAQTQAGIQNATNIQDTPMRYVSQFSNMNNATGGQGGTSTSTQDMQGNRYVGAAGGALIGSQLYRNITG